MRIRQNPLPAKFLANLPAGVKCQSSDAGSILKNSGVDVLPVLEITTNSQFFGIQMPNMKTIYRVESLLVCKKFTKGLDILSLYCIAINVSLSALKVS